MSRFLSRTVSYALQAVLQLADTGSEDPVPCRRLAAQGHMPERFLLQILRSLVTKGILQSSRGVDGGYTLERKLAEVSLLEIIEAVDGPLVAAAPVGEGFPRQSKHRLRAVLEEMTEVVRRQLDSIKLANLLSN
jgi:Rrf2 family transcriptional regulator, cysteine metabolism repressor